MEEGKTLDFSSMGETAEKFEGTNFDRNRWNPEDHADAETAVDFIKEMMDPKGQHYGKKWSHLVGSDPSHQLGNSRVHVKAIAKVARQAERMIEDRFGPSKEKGIRYSMPVNESERRALFGEIKSLLDKELMSADAEYIRRAQRPIEYK